MEKGRGEGERGSPDGPDIEEVKESVRGASRTQSQGQAKVRGANESNLRHRHAPQSIWNQKRVFLW